MPKQDCPCRSGKPYDACCGPFLEGRALPKTPGELMRSRYTAFCKKAPDYLVATLAPEKRATSPEETACLQDLSHTMATTRWLGLRVIREPAPASDTGIVEFAAFFERDKGLGQLHEQSFFIRENGSWYYRDGDILPPVPLARNQACVCGSGLKFKRCHGKT